MLDGLDIWDSEKVLFNHEVAQACAEFVHLAVDVSEKGVT